MARRLRIEEEATYHVINRGNYRSGIFRGEKTKAAFLKCLGEACGGRHDRAQLGSGAAAGPLR